MIGAARSRAALAEGGDSGFTLVELLVAISIFLVLTIAVFSGLVKTAQTVNDVRSISNLTEEARVATERMSRELRQASEILDAHLPVDPATEYTSITFWVDFDGDHFQDVNAVDPEVVTYRFEPGSGQMTLTANDPSGTPVTRPILAAKVTGFVLTFTSSLWEYDTDGDGVTGWREIDASAIGNRNGMLDTDEEFKRIDSVGIKIHLLDGTRTQTYTTQVDLRNQNQS